MKIVNEVLLKVAEELARHYGYIETEHVVEDLRKSDFWGTSFYAAKEFLNTGNVQMFERVKYVKPIFEDEIDPDKSHPRIEMRVRFRNPRLDVRLPNGGFVGLEYTPEGTFAEAQIFGEEGYWAIPVIKELVDRKLQERRSA